MSDASNATAHRPDWPVLGIAAALAAIAAIVLWETAHMSGAGSYARIGPAAFPYAVAGGLAVLAVLTAVAGIRGSFPAREHDEFGPMAWIVGGLVGQMLLLNTAGFSIATAVLFAGTTRGFGRGPLWLTFAVGFGLSLVLWLIFARGLQLSLPAGPIERLFG